MASAFPHHYQVSLKNIQLNKAELVYENAPVIQGGPPKEFDGSPNEWSPEGFLMSAIGLCFLTTLKSFHKDPSIELNNLEIAVDGTLEKTKEGLVFTKIQLHVSCQTNNEEEANKLFHRAEKYCLVSNALKTKPELDIQFS